MNDAVPLTLECVVKKLLTPRGFFVGVIAGFVACCVAGRKAPGFLPIRDFQRFHHALNPNGLYYPTALQVRALARRHLPKEKVAVIVGGSSIMHGYGQSASELWTDHLQRELGPDFRVLNVAMPGGAPNELGLLTAEMLLRDRVRVLYVCNCSLEQFATYPDGRLPVYRYFHYDARARGLLLPWAARQAALAELEAVRREHENFDELLLRTHTNALLSFNELWQVLGYEVGFTAWSKHFYYSPWRARKRQPERPPPKMRYPGDHRRQLAIIRQESRPNSAEDWAVFARQVRQAVPPALRARTLASVNRTSPYYVRMADAETPGFEAGHNQKIQDTITHLRACGLNALDGCAGMTPDDYLDRHHLLPSGGAKLARTLAPAIRDLATRLGYFSGDAP